MKYGLCSYKLVTSLAGLQAIIVQIAHFFLGRCNMHIDFSGKWAPQESIDGNSAVTLKASLYAIWYYSSRRLFHTWDVFSIFILISFLVQRICVDSSVFSSLFIFSFVCILLKGAHCQLLPPLCGQLFKSVSTWIQLKS